MALIAVLGDSHFGARGESPAFMQAMEDFFNKVFFPEIDRRKIPYVVHAGDLVDRKKFIAYTTANRMRRCFVEELARRELLAFFIPGNHDCYYRHSLHINGITEMVGRSERFKVMTEPTEGWFERLHTLFLPWICEANQTQAMEMVSKFRGGLCIGHLELAGFETYRGHVHEKGMDAQLFKNFDRVFSGHYHHPSLKGNVQYLGAPYELTWADYDSPRGFWVFNTDNLSLEFIQNPERMHYKVTYDDKHFASPIGYEKYAGKVVKVIVFNRTDHGFFERQIKNLESVAADVQVVEDHMNQDEKLPEVELEAVGGPLDTLVDVIVDSPIKVDRAEIMALMRELYQEAVLTGGE